VEGNRALFLAASPTERGCVALLDLATRDLRVLRRASDQEVDPSYISVPEPIEFPTGDGETAHAFHYAPHSPEFTAPAGSLPPLIVMSHGGPTGSTSASLDLHVQYWTSRGFAVVDVNYRGSTGYGRAYRDRLKGNWGLFDVEDCERAALHLIAEGKADPRMVAIRGGSAGGYTTLRALATRDTFKAGASLFGIGDLEIFTGDTHKFESRYVDSLVGPYPEMRAVYRERSPINHLDGFHAPCIFFQGLDDKIVPPNQAELMVRALREKGVPVAYLAYAGEGHGFRQAQNIKRTLDAELYFYSRIFRFDLPDPVAAVPIENLDAWDGRA
jgi:dipeptidyl aminopeptidase/acylaminoacyl peptidase